MTFSEFKRTEVPQLRQPWPWTSHIDQHTHTHSTHPKCTSSWSNCRTQSRAWNGKTRTSRTSNWTLSPPRKRSRADCSPSGMESGRNDQRSSQTADRQRRRQWRKWLARRPEAPRCRTPNPAETKFNELILIIRFICLWKNLGVADRGIQYVRSVN